MPCASMWTPPSATSEGIDDLARFLDGDKVKELTAKAMGGSMPYHEALELRLNAMRPSETQVATMLGRSRCSSRPASLSS